jgi:hypothetical protein
MPFEPTTRLRLRRWGFKDGTLTRRRKVRRQLSRCSESAAPAEHPDVSAFSLESLDKMAQRA